VHSAPIAGPAGASVRLDVEPNGSLAYGFRITADSTRVLFSTSPDFGPVVRETYSVPIAGPASAAVLVTWPSETGDFCLLSPDGRHVVWEPADNGVLFRTPSTGPLDLSVRINGDEDPEVAAIDPSSRRVTYPVDQAGGQRDLFSVPIGGSGTRYNLTATLDAVFIPTSYKLTASHAVYPATPDFDGSHLYSSRLVPG
jgi:hypothetical protein